MLQFYRFNDYDQVSFKRFYRCRTYLKLQDKIKTIAIYKSGGGLGDLIHSIPLFRSLKEMFPEARIVYLGLYQRPRCDTLFRNIPYIDEYIEYIRPSQKGTFKGYVSFLKQYYKKFDLIVDTQAKFIPSLYLWLLNARYFISRLPIFSSWALLLNPRIEVHVTSKMLSLVRILGCETINYNPTVDISNKYLSPAQNYLKNFSGPFISILPGAGHPYKMWDKKSLSILADKFYEIGYKIILVGAQSERELLLEVADLMHNTPIIPLIDDPKFGRDLIYSIGLFKSSVLTIGCDCGGLHLATLVGCPVVAIFGPTNPIKSGPLGRRNVVLYKELDCSPCRMNNCKIKRRCLTDITPDEVLAAANFILRRISCVN